MLEILMVFCFLACVGLIVFYRYSDMRNVSVSQLKDFLKQSELHIETMLRKKEKEFNDKMISSEIAIERMQRLANTLQEKLDLFDKDIIQGQELFESLREELQKVDKELYEYKEIRHEFRDIEERVTEILNIKKQADEGRKELLELKQEVSEFSTHFQFMTEDINIKSRQELDTFFQTMQEDLNDYLGRSRQQLFDKDNEITTQIQELGVASHSMAESIRNFKEYAQHSMDQLKKEYEEDLTILRSATDVNITDIYDLWQKVKDDTKTDTELFIANLQEQKNYFDIAKENISEDLLNFNNQLSSLSIEAQTNIEFNLREKQYELDNKIIEVFTEIESKGEEIQNNISDTLKTQISVVKEELDRVYSAFVEQEQSMEDRIRVLSSRISEGLNLAEGNFHENLTELQKTVDETKHYAENILSDSQTQLEEKITFIEESFRNKAQENMSRIEETFREVNQERVAQSINEITASLEIEFKKRYQENIQAILSKTTELEDTVNSKVILAQELDERFRQLDEMFNQEKEDIILMSAELEKDRERSTAEVLGRANEYIISLKEHLTEEVKEFLDQGQQSFINEQELWQERFDNTVKEGRDEFQRIKTDIDNINRTISNIEDTSLSTLKREAEKVVHDTEYKIDDLKKLITGTLRSNKEDFLSQTDHVRQEIKDLRQGLWDNTKEVQQMAEKDLERLSQKAKDVDEQFQNFIKRSEKLDEIEEAMRTFTQQRFEINDLKQSLESVTSDLKQSYNSGEELFQKLQNYHEVLDNKTENIQNSFSEADRMQETLLKTIQDAQNIKDLFNTLAEEREKAQIIEDLLLKNLEVFDNLQDSLDLLEERRITVEKMMTALTDSQQRLSVINDSSDEINNRIHELNNYTQEITEQMGSLQKDMKELTGDQTQIKSAVSKIHDLEHVVIHIDEEMKRLDKMRDWIAKSMTNIDKIGTQLGRGSFSESSNQPDETDIKNILRLYEKDWSIGDIAKNLKLSTAYVELIIERFRD